MPLRPSNILSQNNIELCETGRFEVDPAAAGLRLRGIPRAYTARPLDSGLF